MRYLFGFCLAALAAFPCAARDGNFDGKLLDAEGTVMYLKAGSTSWLPVKASILIAAGDRLRTGPGSKAELSVRDGSRIRLGADAVFSLDRITPDESSVEIIEGKVRASVRRSGDRIFMVRTLSALCAARDAVFEVEMDSAGLTSVNVLSGAVQVSDSGNNNMTLTMTQQAVVSYEKGLAPPPAAVIETPAVQEGFEFRGSTP